MSVKESVVMAPPLPPPSRSDSSTDEVKKDCKKMGIRSMHQRQSASTASSGRDTWSLKRDIAGLDVAAKRNQANVSDTAPKRMVLHATDSHYQSVVKHNNCRLLDKSQIYNEKMAASMGKYIKGMETLMKA